MRIGFSYRCKTNLFQPERKKKIIQNFRLRGLFVNLHVFVQLSIVIVNYNVKHFVEQCLHSVYKALKGIEAEVFVVDNNGPLANHVLLP